uniref:Metalloendopeptidase n=1 Tax=Strongyloides stercoralis TaxID=6248 RepID=A0A0K0EP81_STRER
MKSKIYIYISTIVFFVLIINLWKARKNIPHSYISVNNDVIFIDSHNDFKRDIYTNNDPWISPINYCVDNSVNEANVKIAISAIENNTCVQFQKQTHCNDDRQEIIFKKGSICASWIGHVSGNHSQIINLTYDCNNRPLSILHEIGHALGLIHEQSRRDRDEFVEVDYNSLTSNQGHNFQVYKNSKYKNFTTSYDYASIMHYEPYSFATTWRWLLGYPVIKPKVHWQYSSMMGQRKKMTFNEFKKINLCYCDICKWIDDRTGKRKKNHRTPCRNSGYPDFNNCSKCICPTGYTGDYCQDIISSDESCGKTTFKVNDTGTLLILKGQKNCNIFLQAKDEGKKIELYILYANAPYEDKICTEDVGYQFKYRKDKGATGLLLCGPYIDNTKINSESDSILVMFKGNSGHSFLSLFFKQISK